MTAASLALCLWAFFLAVCLVKSCWSVDWCAQCVLCSPQKKKKLQVWQDRKSDILEVKGHRGWIGGAALWHCRFFRRCFCVQFRLNFEILFVSMSTFSVGDMDRQQSSCIHRPQQYLYFVMILLWTTARYILFIIALFSKLKHIKILKHGSSILFRFVQFAGQKLQPWKQSHRI